MKANQIMILDVRGCESGVKVVFEFGGATQVVVVVCAPADRAFLRGLCFAKPVKIFLVGVL